MVSLIDELLWTWSLYGLGGVGWFVGGVGWLSGVLGWCGWFAQSF